MANESEKGNLLKKYLKQDQLPEDRQQVPANQSDGQQERHDQLPRNGDDEFVVGALVVLPASVAAMLDLRFKNGNRVALPYGYITSLVLDPSVGLQIRMADCVVKIKGRLLEPIYKAIANHTALAVVECQSGFDEGGDVPFVQSIIIDDSK